MDALRVYTYVGKDGNADDAYFESRGNGSFLIPKNTVLFYAHAGVATHGHVFLSDLNTTFPTVSVFNTFHAALLSLRSSKRLYTAKLYVLQAITDVEVAAVKSDGTYVTSEELKVEDVAPGPQQTHKFNVDSLTAKSLRILFDLQIPLSSTTSAYLGFPQGIFVDAPFPKQDGEKEQAANSADETMFAQFDPLVALTQHEEPESDSLLRALIAAIKYHEEDMDFSAEWQRGLFAALSYDDPKNLPSVARLTAESNAQVAVEVLKSASIGEDHDQFMRLCYASADNSYTEAALFAWLKCVGHWPNRVVFSVTKKNPESNAESTPLRVYNAGGNIKHHWLSGSLQTRGFIAFDVGLTHRGWPRVNVNLLGAASTDDRGPVSEAIPRLAYTFRRAIATHGDTFSFDRDRVILRNSVNAVAPWCLLNRTERMRQDDEEPYKRSDRAFPGMGRIPAMLSRQVELYKPPPVATALVVSRPHLSIENLTSRARAGDRAKRTRVASVLADPQVTREQRKRANLGTIGGLVMDLEMSEDSSESLSQSEQHLSESLRRTRELSRL